MGPLFSKRRATLRHLQPGTPTHVLEGRVTVGNLTGPRLGERQIEEAARSAAPEHGTHGRARAVRLKARTLHGPGRTSLSSRW